LHALPNQNTLTNLLFSNYLSQLHSKFLLSKLRFISDIMDYYWPVMTSHKRTSL